MIPLYPLIGALLSIPWSPAFIRLTGPRPAGYINLLASLFTFTHGLLALMAVWGQTPLREQVTWLQVADLTLTIPLEFSALTLGVVVLVSGLNLLAQFYAIGYLEMDWGWARFYALLALFEAGMCALALCDSLFFAYMILEILTLGTYLLVGLWFNQSLVVTGARDAFLTKRIGDLILLMGVLAIYPLTGTWNFDELAVWAQTAQVDPTLMTLIGIALVAGPMSKCAQFPLHLWLDEAMEGPLPSTILRNSVVVATGAWILVKLAPVIALSPAASLFAVSIGGVTALGGAMISAAQVDIKRVLSYLTSAFMGLIFMAVGTHQTEAALLLTLSHALASALLVMSTGSIVFNCITQDVTQLGGLWQRRPMTGLALLVGIAGLVGLPPLGGFWALLELTNGLWVNGQNSWVFLVLAVNWVSAFSLMRLFGLIFAGPTQQMTIRAPEPIWFIIVPMMMMVGFTLHLPLILGSLGLLPAWADLNKDLALLLTWSTLLGGAMGAVLYVGRMMENPSRLMQRSLQNLLAYDFYTPKLYRNTVVLFVDRLSRLTDWLDRYVVDGLVNFLGLASLFGGETLKYGNTGQSQFYILTIVVGVILFGFGMSWAYLPW